MALSDCAYPCIDSGLIGTKYVARQSLSHLPVIESLYKINYVLWRKHTVLSCVVSSNIDCCVNLFPLIPACTARPGLPLSPPETAFLESPYYRPQTASIGDRHHPTNFHSVTYTQTDDAAFEAGSDNDHKSFLRMRVIFKVEYPAELFRFRRVLDDILSSFDVF